MDDIDLSLDNVEELNDKQPESIILEKQIELLQLAKNSNILFLSNSDFSKDVASRCKEDFSNVYVTHETKDFIQIIEKQNRKMDLNAIDAVIIDSSTSAVRAIRYIQERSKEPKFINFPIIAVILLLSLDTDDSLIEEFNCMSCISATIKLPVRPVDCFATIIESIYRGTTIDVAYRDIKHTAQSSKTYPYIPVFDNLTIVKKLDNNSDSEDESISSNRSYNNFSEFILEDDVINDTTTTSIIPNVLRDLVKQQETLFFSPNTRFAKNRLSSSGNISSFKKNLIKSSLKKHNPLIRNYSDERVVPLLDSRRRPKWDMTGSTNKLKSLSDIDVQGKLVIDKAPPDLLTTSTVAGLNKKDADGCWNAIRSFGDLERAHSKLLRGQKNNYAPIKPKVDIGKIKVESSLKELVTTPSQSLNSDSLSEAETGNSMNISNKLRRKFSSSLPALNIDAIRQESSPLNPTPINMHKKDVQNISSIQIKEISSKSAWIPDSLMQFDRSDDALTNYRKTIDLAQRRLIQMARETPTEVQINKLCEISLSHRTMNFAEKSLLEEGLRAEKLGNYDHAVMSFTRAGSNGRESHISLLYLGAFHFRCSKFFNAIRNYSDALRIINNLKSASILFNSKDEFAARFNRSLCYFRVGNDPLGVVDLEYALKIDGDNIQALEVYAIVLRRVGKYDDAIRIKGNLMMREAEIKRATINDLHDLSDLDSQLLDEERDQIGDVGTLIRRPSSKYSRATSARSSKNSRKSSKSSKSGNEDDLIYDEDEPKVISISIPPLKVASSIQDRINEKLRSVTRDRPTSTTHESLNSFKLVNGFKGSIFDSIFLKPTPLQEALLKPPNGRSMSDVELIASHLKLFPFLRDIPSSIISQLADIFEYRTLEPHTNIYTQGSSCDSFCIVLEGRVNMKLDLPSSASITELQAASEILCELSSSVSFGYIDLLFQSQETNFIKGLRKDIFDCEEMNEMATNIPSAAANTINFSRPSTTNSQVDIPLTARSSNSINSKLSDSNNTKHIHKGSFKRLNSTENASSFQSNNNYRSLAPSIFSSFTTKAYCEILLLPDKDFQKYLYNYAATDFQKRYEVIQSCGIFNSLEKNDHIRLVRMSRLQSFKAGEIILSQKQKPDYLYFIIQGLCHVKKKPNSIEVLERDLAQLKSKAEKHDSQYCYNHKLRNVIPHKTFNECIQQNEDKITRPAVLKGMSSVKAFYDELAPTSVLRADPLSLLSQSEEYRYKLELEIRTVEYQLNSLLERQNKHNLSEASGSITHDIYFDEECDITVLKWPQLFGEACVLEPENGMSRGTITAKTDCEILLIHKVQLKTFQITEEVIEALSRHSVEYPNDRTLVHILFEKKKFLEFKDKNTRKIFSKRWPKTDKIIK